MHQILVIGDSHGAVFGHRRFVQEYPDFRFNSCLVGGATASGLQNPNSKTQARHRFATALAGSYPDRVLLLLGEVDAGFVIWYRAARHGCDLAETFRQAVESYLEYISSLVSDGRDPIVISAPLPTIGDGHPWGEVANLRREVTATQAERTELTLAFNRAVAGACDAAQLAFVDLDRDSLGPDGLVRAELRCADPCDHHYDQAAYAALLCDRLRPILRDATAGAADASTASVA